MTPHYETPEVTLWHGDCLDVLARLGDASVDAVVTDPPYGLGFMGKEWDRDFTPGDSPMRRNATLDAVNAGAARQGGRQRAGADYQKRMARDSRAFQEWCEQWAAECLRVLKPGGHLLAFGGTRTWHRLACAIEDAGFEVRDSIAWMYGSGFPKSLDVSKAIDKASGAEREVLRETTTNRDGGSWADQVQSGMFQTGERVVQTTAPATDAARTWQGWGTALKPAFEPVVVARKPLTGTVAGNVLTYGTGALNIDACRVEASGRPLIESRAEASVSTFGDGLNGSRHAGSTDQGRWPANVVLDEDQAAALDEQSGESTTPSTVTRGAQRTGDSGLGALGRQDDVPCYGDTGGASRFFYVAKADASERPKVAGVAHPTVKPLALMRWLVRLVTPPGGIVLEPFAGSGTTIEACLIEGFHCVAIEKTDEYLPLIEARIHRRRDPVAATRLAADDEANLFDLFDEEGA